MTDVDQLLFGYDQGHRMLGGSRSLGRPALTRLLGATDASPAGDSDTLITALPLPDEGLYALSATWSAPEITRPGAVWAHVLLVDLDAIAQSEDPMSLRTLIKRPTLSTVAEYEAALRWNDSRADLATPPDEVLRELVVAEYGTRSDKVVIVRDLRWAEAAFALIWRTQWPALRATFEFRTRDVARLATAGQALIATRRVQGKRPSGQVSSERWAQMLASSLAGGAPRQLPAFLRLFGPGEASAPDAAVALTEIYDNIDRGDVVATARALEKRYATGESGQKLKVDLFGRNDEVWRAPERDRVLAVLASSVDAWPNAALELSTRLNALMAIEGVTPVARVLSEPTPPSISDAVVASLIAREDPADAPVLAESHADLVRSWLCAQPEIGDSPSAWRAMPPATARRLLEELGPGRTGVVVAVARAGHGQAAVDAFSLDVVLHALADHAQLDLAAELIRHQPQGAAEQLHDPEAILVALAGAPDLGSTTAARHALVQTRSDPNELWLSAAVAALTNTRFEIGDTLEVVFGPLHNAVTSDRLPRKLWTKLGQVTPPAGDPALRLRRLLVKVAREQRWQPERIIRAIDGAGPFVSELRRDIERSDEHHDEWWMEAAKAVARVVGWPIR